MSIHNQKKVEDARANFNAYNRRNATKIFLKKFQKCIDIVISNGYNIVKVKRCGSPKGLERWRNAKY